MSGPDSLIADALRGIADQAAAPRPMADAAWGAGRRRRRLGVMATSAAIAAAAVAAAVLLSLAAAGGPLHRTGPALSPAAPISLTSPITVRQVATIGAAPCAAGSQGLPGSPAPGCFYLTGTGMTLTTVESAVVIEPEPGQYGLTFSLTPADTGPFAALTRELAGLPSPRDQLAIIVGGQVIAHPVVLSQMPRDQIQIAGFTSRAQAENVLSGLTR